MHTKVKDALGALPADLAAAIKPVLEADNFDATLSPEAFAELLSKTQLSDSELRVALLPLAAAYSVAPISRFHVGAIARGLSGTLYFGANMEFVGTDLSHSVHAEQSAISHAWLKGETGIQDITINYSPCGHCRQFMNELTTANDLMVQLPQRDAKTLQAYLPESFGPGDLNITDALLTHVNHGMTCDDTDALLQAACEAANRAHAPYTSNFAGVALRTQSGDMFVGMYAENAAFNPSLPPLQVALINMNMAGYDLSEIAAAALVEKAGSTISHRANTEHALHALNVDIPFRYLAV